MDCTKSSTEALLFFGVLAQLHTVLFFFHITLDNYEEVYKNFNSISICHPSGKSNQMYCIVTILLVRRFGCTGRIAELLIQKQDGKTANDACSLINVISSWKFILAIVIRHDILFQVNKTCKLATFHRML